MKKILGLTILAAALFLGACKKDDYIIGGGTHNAKVDMSTLDYLRKNPLFDTLCMIIDKTGSADLINESGISFFAPTDYHIKTLIDARHGRVVAMDARKQYTVDSLIKYHGQGFKDSIRIHIIKRSFPYSALKEDRQTFATTFPGVSADISYREVKKEEYGYNPATGIFPRIVYYRIKNLETYCQTSGIITNTGMLFVLQNPEGFEAGKPTLYFGIN